MIACPNCGSVNLRTHGAIQTIAWKPRMAFPWPVRVPRGTTVAIECSCSECLFTFVSWADGRVAATALQSAYDQLRAAQAAASEKDRKTPDGDKPVARSSVPRPAPDPRIRRR